MSFPRPPGAPLEATTVPCSVCLSCKSLHVHGCVCLCVHHPLFLMDILHIFVVYLAFCSQKYMLESVLYQYMGN